MAIEATTHHRNETHGLNKGNFTLTNRQRDIIKVEYQHVGNRPIVTTFSGCYIRISIRIKSLLADSYKQKSGPVIGCMLPEYKLAGFANLGEHVCFGDLR